MEITAALQWLHVGPQTLPGPLPISAFALVLGVGWGESEVSLCLSELLLILKVSYYSWARV